ncbi:hypothetical protein ABVK25_001245 [Lepraria finkii]|uniref:Uncharacterized protein n=1 Tax=Lepraria finkii TaxID=1340010 RepID=A0ABR4BMA1_9LECA
MATPICKAILTVLTTIYGIRHPVNLLHNEMHNRDLDFLSPATRSEGSMVCVQLALNCYQGLSQAEGDTPNIVAFDENKEYIGASNCHDNGVCVAYVSQMQADGTPRGSLGDMGRTCRKRWYFTNIEVGDGRHKSDCVWLNWDGERDGSEPKGDHNEAAAMQIHMEALYKLHH